MDSFKNVKNWKDFIAFCDRNGFDYAEDDDGQLIIYTGKKVNENIVIDDYHAIVDLNP